MIAVDDLRPVGKLFGEPEIHAPNLDRLAARSTIFTNAFSQSPTCGVSRSSLLTGRRPDTTYVLDNGGCPFTSAQTHSAWQSLPQYFRAAGYRTAGHGKIFHPNVCEGAAVGEQAAAWSSGYYHAPCIGGGSLYAGGCSDPAAAHTNPPPYYHPCEPPCIVTSAYANATAADDDMPDGMIAREAVRTIHRLAAEESGADAPFFVAVGFHKPHLPHIAPKRYFDLYPAENVSLPPCPRAPRGAPAFAWNKCSEWTAYPDVRNKTGAMGFSREQPVDDDFARQQRRAYFAAASFADAQVGRVLDAVEEVGLANRTVVVLFGDHGWHLGDNNEWAKHTAMTRANRAPLLFAAPGARPGVRRGYAELVDVFATLADLAGIAVPPRCATEEQSQTLAACTEGASLRPLIMPQVAGSGGDVREKAAAFGQWSLGGHMGYNLYSALEDGSEIRYTEWTKYNTTSHGPVWSHVAGRELYNRSADPEEGENIAERAGLKDVVARLSQRLRAGWRAIAPPHALPKPPRLVDAAPPANVSVTAGGGAFIWSFASTPQGYALGTILLGGVAIDAPWTGGLLLTHSTANREGGRAGAAPAAAARGWVYAAKAKQLSASAVQFQGNAALGSCNIVFNVSVSAHGGDAPGGTKVAFNTSWNVLPANGGRSRSHGHSCPHSLSVPLFGDATRQPSWRSFMYPWAGNSTEIDQVPLQYVGVPAALLFRPDWSYAVLHGLDPSSDYLNPNTWTGATGYSMGNGRAPAWSFGGGNMSSAVQYNASVQLIFSAKGSMPGAVNELVSGWRSWNKYAVQGLH
eukprot:g7433.t1